MYKYELYHDHTVPRMKPVPNSDTYEEEMKYTNLGLQPPSSSTASGSGSGSSSISSISSDEVSEKKEVQVVDESKTVEEGQTAQQ